MPIIKQAAKKLRHDRRKTVQNAQVKRGVRKIVKEMRDAPTKKKLTQVFQTLDKATKFKIIHPNKAARLKSRLSSLLKK